MREGQKTVDFGAPDVFGAHVFRVEIPRARKEDVIIVEDYGHLGQEGGLPKEEPRVVLARANWAGIADIARREFNARLKAEKVTTGRWHSGANLVDRLLGKELCVLAWAAETAEPAKLPAISNRWAALRPEERWWLFAVTVSEAGLPEDRERGWRRALYHALSDGEVPPPEKRRRRPKDADPVALPLFEDF